MTNLRRFRQLARNWEALGESDPMFGVLSDPTKFDGKWDTEEFFGTGRAHVDHLFQVLAEHGVAVPSGGACLDFGCGVGRLTIPLAERFSRTVGVDVAPSMVEAARRHVLSGDRCEFVTNPHPDLRQFETGTFDFVHSCLVLQHIPPEFATRYVGEFLRIARPGGLAVFQIPAETRAESVIYEMQALPAEACRARIEILNPPASIEAGRRASLRIRVTNESAAEWQYDIPGGYHLCVGNHWLREDGSVLMPDDGRTFLTKTLTPGDSVDMRLTVEAPTAPGRYFVEVDLVQEKVRWFAEAGSPTARAPVAVEAAPARSAAAVAPLGQPVRRLSLFDRLRRTLRRATPTFEMHCVPREEIERVVQAAGGDVLHAIDDNAAGASWVSYTYVCRAGGPDKDR